jgi:hypothetical protein
VLLIALGVLGTALGIAAGHRGRARVSSRSTVTIGVPGKSAEPSTPGASEVNEEPTGTPSPVLTY